jgi:outer membrane protein
MKNINYIINGVLIVAIVILFVLQFAEKKQCAKDDINLCGDSITTHLPVAYVNADSLLTHFNFYTHLVTDYESKATKQNGLLSQRYEKFQKDVVEYQQKAQNNAYLSMEKMQQEETRLGRVQREIEQSAAQMEQELALEQRIIQQRLSDTLSLAMKEFNEPQKYQLIFTKTGNSNILYANETYDITQDVIDFLNKRYLVEE